MSFTNRLKVFKTIKFRLTLMNSMIIFLVCGTLVLLFNIYLNNYLKADPIIPDKSRVFINNDSQNFNEGAFPELPFEERARIKQIRLNDLNKFRELSILSLGPIFVLSFALGYFLAGEYLDPLRDLSLHIKSINSEAIGTMIPKTTDDEIGDLVDSFNEMSLKLKSTFDSQKQFVEDASHELKTPLTIIQANLDTVSDDPKASKQEMREAIADAQIGLKKARALVNDLLQLAVPSKNKVKLNLLEVLQEQVDAIQPFAKENNVKVSLNLNAGKNIRIMGERLPLGRAVMNLLNNAVKYSSGSKKAEVKVDLKRHAKSAVLEIQDNGVGITKDELPHIFERFYRVEKSRNSELGGVGLGLAITKKIIEEHDGSLSVESKPHDTKFVITLPIQK